MASGDDDIVYKVSEDDRSDDLVDDEALIKAYNRAVSTNENEFTLQKQPSTSTTGSGSHKQQKKKGSKKTDTQASSKARDWKVGDFCRCTYSVDGRCYEAKIKCVDQEACTVRYIGYGNEEEVYLSELLPSEGKFARQRQTDQARRENATSSPTPPSEEERGATAGHAARVLEAHHQHHDASSLPPFAMPVPPVEPLFSRLPPFMKQPIPPPPPICHGDLRNNEEALASMLMSWYMTGYHTGYYQGLQESKATKKERCCCKHSCHK
ncbi:unnamed protein product [Ixodes persulcatus]